jgi:hypothetical protein
LFSDPLATEQWAALQPAERLWALTNAALTNRQFASIDALEDAQADRVSP